MPDAPPYSVDFPPPCDGRPDVLVVAGEHSGDEHAARMVRRLLALRPGAKVAALGGPELERAGAQLLFDMTESSVVGLFEVLKNYGFFKEQLEKMVRWIAKHRPRAICFVDYPGFNLRLAKRLCGEGLACKGGGEIPLLYYIGPQVWAWKARRRFRMAETLDALGVIFPFEVGCFADTNLPVDFVGHPFVADDFLPPVTYAADGPALLLPGSRSAAVGRIFPVMADAFGALASKRPELRANVIYPSAGIAANLRSVLATREGVADRLTLLPTGQPVAGRAVLTSSGTMSLACALAGLPGAIAYRAHPITYWLLRPIVNIQYIGIANILLDRPSYAEFIQGAATPEGLAAELEKLADDPKCAREAQDDAGRLREILSAEKHSSAGDWLCERIRG